MRLRAERRFFATRADAAHRAAADERGVVMVFVAISLVVLLGMAAMAVDISSFYKAQRQAQSAADSAALAASYDLPFSTTSATTDANFYVQQNDPGATPTISTPYNSSSSAVQVIVNTTSPSFFGTLFGLTSAKITATAVAGGKGTVARGAIFAYDNAGTGCATGINLGTNNLTITGGIESNGSLTSSSNSGTQFGSGTFGTGCTYTGSTSNWTTPPFAASPQNWPIDYRNSTPVSQGAAGCTSSFSGNYTYSTPVTVSSTNVVICATGTLTVSASATNSCTPSTTVTSCPGITFEAPQIIVQGSGLNLSAPYSNGTYGLLAYQSGPSSAAASTCANGMGLSANSSTLNGAIFAPNAEIEITGNSSGTGFIEGNTVITGGDNGGALCGNGSSGNGFSIIGDGPPVASNGYALLQ
jgi:Flp pilus assembly protein TadG